MVHFRQHGCTTASPAEECFHGQLAQWCWVYQDLPSRHGWYFVCYQYCVGSLIKWHQEETGMFSSAVIFSHVMFLFIWDANIFFLFTFKYIAFVLIHHSKLEKFIFSPVCFPLPLTVEFHALKTASSSSWVCICLHTFQQPYISHIFSTNI